MPKPLNLSPEVQAGLDAMDRPPASAPDFDPRLLGQLSATGIHIDSDPERMMDSDPSNPNSGPNSLTPENQTLLETLLESQLEPALKAHNTLSDSLLSASHVAPEKLKEELGHWLTDKKLDYVRSQIEQDSSLEFTLVATPNVLLSNHAELFSTAKAFGCAPQPYETWIYDEKMNDDFYSTYTKEELSGTDPSSGNSIQFSLIPSKVNPELTGKTAQQQKDTLQNDLLPAMPSLRVPSVLESIAYWQTLRAGLPDGQALQDYDKTLIRHFDLQEKLVGVLVLVPASLVNADGRPYLDDSLASRGRACRLLVG